MADSKDDFLIRLESLISQTGCREWLGGVVEQWATSAAIKGADGHFHGGEVLLPPRKRNELTDADCVAAMAAIHDAWTNCQRVVPDLPGKPVVEASGKNDEGEYLFAAGNRKDLIRYMAWQGLYIGAGVTDFSQSRVELEAMFLKVEQAWEADKLKPASKIKTAKKRKPGRPCASESNRDKEMRIYEAWDYGFKNGHYKTYQDLANARREGESGEDIRKTVDRCRKRQEKETAKDARYLSWCDHENF